jgi:hypothetical protein
MPADDRRGNDRPNYIVLYGHVVRGPAARRHESRPCDPARRASCPFIATGGARLGRFDGRRSRTYTYSTFYVLWLWDLCASGLHWAPIPHNARVHARLHVRQGRNGGPVLT